MRNRRGLSTVVGAVFFIIAMTMTITYISSSMETLDQFAQNVMVKSSLEQDRTNEDFHITKATIDGNKFNLTVQNTGNIPITLTRLYIQNTTTTATDKTPGKYDLTTGNVISPGQTKNNIGQSLSISPGDNGASYDMKLMTDKGNKKQFSLQGGGSEPVYLQLHAIPREVSTNFDTTLLFTVKNNMSRNDVLLNVKPVDPPIISGSASAAWVSGPNPPSYTSLDAGDSTTFEWVYSISGNDGNSVSFTASLENGMPDNTATATVKVSDVEVSTEATVLWSEAARNAGLLIGGLPNPINGAGDGLGKFGIVIINPLERDILVYSVAVLSHNNKIFQKTPVGIEPTSGTWDYYDGQPFPGGLVWWEGPTPITVVAHEVAEFRFEYDVDGNQIRETDIMVEALTSEGKFISLNTISVNNPYPTMNVYYTPDPLDPTNNWTYSMTGIKGGVPTVFNATLENSHTSVMNSEAKMIIITPSDFGVPTSYGANSGWDNASILTNPDGSHKIEVKTSAHFGANNAKVYQFQVTPDTVSSENLYVLKTTSIFTDDWTNGMKIIAPVSEAGVQIVP